MKKIRYLVFLLIIASFSNKVYAASISVSSSSNTAVVGNTISVFITISSDVEAWDFLVGYDTSKLRLSTSQLESTTHSVSTSTLRPSRSYTLTFRTISSGTANVYVSSADCAGLTCTKGSKSISIKTQAEIEATYSKNNNLSSLSVDGADLLPSFNKDTLEYTVELAPETTKVNIQASPEDSRSKITGAGEREVVDGDNEIKIDVTAENGTSRTYIIKATVKEYNPIEVKTGNEKMTVVRKKSLLNPPTHYTESSVKINEEEIPAYYSEITKYTLVALKDEKGVQNWYVYDKGNYTLYKEYTFGKTILYLMDIDKELLPNNYKKTTINYNDDKIVAYKLNETSKYALLYAMNVETGEKHLYMYDAKEDSVQIYNDEAIKQLETKNELYLKGFIGMGSGLVLSVGIIIFMLIKNKKNKKSQN